MCENSGSFEKYVENGDVVDSKIRKFFFKLRDNEVERDLRVTVRIITSERDDNQKIVIELTNDSNPIFLFTLFITKNDFDILRNDQGINVDFKDFPLALVNLLDKCADAVTSAGTGTFKLMLEDYCGTVGGGCIKDMKKCRIKILEECAFKNMCHLTLDVLRGSDLQIQQKLEVELCKTRQCLSQESKLHDEALRKISELVEDNNEKCKNIENLNAVIDNMKTERLEECKKQQQLFELKENQLREEYEKKLFQEQEQFLKKYEGSQKKVEALEEEINKITEKQFEMTSKVLEKEKEVEISKVELTAAKHEISLLRNQNLKLDSDYHDKEKTVNILRTRLAVAEQELKDNNILLLNHQKKLEESSKEKTDLQNNLDFIKNKLEKKESIVLNLSEELLKGNEIISKQQAKISILTTKLKECEEVVQEKERLIIEKENILQRKDEDIVKLQEKLAESNEQLVSVNERIKVMDIKFKEKNEKLESTLKVVAVLKKNIQNNFSHLKPNSSQKSLLFYRAFLSMPSLLPSDVNRRMIELNYPLVNEPLMDDDYHNLNHLPNITPSETSDIIEKYLARYSRRFQFIPLSLFKSAEVPMTVLASPDGSEFPVMGPSYPNCFSYSQPMINFPCKVTHSDPRNSKESTNKYLAFTLPTKSFPSRIVSDSSLNNNEHVEYKQLVATCSSESGNSEDKHFSNQKESGPQYSPVGGFRFRPTLRHNNLMSSSRGCLTSTKSNNVDNLCLMKPYLRSTPAITAPPLTQRQKETKELALKFRHSQPRKAQATQIPDPLNLHVSNTTGNINRLPKTSHQIKPVNRFNCHVPNLSKKAHQETEPSAYFVG